MEKQQAKIFRSQDVPKEPGVYVFRNAAGEVIYVGKARNLRNRMRSYFMPSTALKEEPRRRALIHSIASYETFKVATESEALLLEAQFIKQYAPRYNVLMRDDKRYLLVAVNPHETFPRFFFERVRKDESCLYFGPFPHAYALRETIRLLESKFGLRSCQCASPGEEEHKHCLQDVLRDCSAPCIGAISEEEYRKRLDGALSVLRGEESARELLKEVDAKMREAAEKLDFESAAKWRDVIGHLKVVLEPTRRFINQTIARRTNPEVNTAGMNALKEALNLDVEPKYMECFDMSNISGTLAVGSMVLFRDGHPCTSEYRRYRIRNQEATDDTAFMHEVLTRRYTRLLNEHAPLPDLVVLDGGVPQVNTGIRVWQELGLTIPFIGLAERYELVVIPHQSEPLFLPRENPGLRLLQAIRDEAHRWANGYNRKLRIERIKESVLGEIPGVGPLRQAELLKQCGSIKRILTMTPSQIAAKIPGLGTQLAQRILDVLKQHASSPLPGTTL
ncbi:MAG: excinuclease ABC subunit UvrC [Lentisphaeria bacterium]|nr:excinuclease ABC subunit UvrC [Lentisphaeria bacterium]